jgi:uncharacterized FlaG/YvyC family protein
MSVVMNVKNIAAGPILAPDPKPRVSGEVRTQHSADRDADGKREGETKEQKQHLTDPEFEEALKILKELPGLKASDLHIVVERSENLRVVLIKDYSGKVIRRLTEGQLWLATRDKDRQTGTILDKAM